MIKIMYCALYGSLAAMHTVQQTHTHTVTGKYCTHGTGSPRQLVSLHILLYIMHAVRAKGDISHSATTSFIEGDT